MGIVQWHSLFFTLALVLFALASWRYSKGIVANLLRLDYLAVIGTGVSMIIGYGYTGITLVKGLLALLLIGVMEMIVTRRRKGKPTAKLWPVFGLMLVLVMFVGFVLI